MNKHLEFDELAEDEMEPWLIKATDSLVDSGRLPLSDDVWATDDYADIIFSKAEDMYDDFVYEQRNVNSSSEKNEVEPF